MATFYLDFEGGSDANDGTTFANRWKTFGSGATAGRIAPGDTIRVKASPAATSLGMTGAWTNKSPTVTLGSSLNALITDCDTAWTGATNITVTSDSSIYRTGTASVNIAPAGAFTTGLMAHFPLGSAQDYSAYQGITFWIQAGGVFAANSLSIRLCSDTAGVTAVDTFLLPELFANKWTPIYLDKGSALGSSIQSIALYAEVDPSTSTVKLDHISTVKAAGNDNLNLTSLIGKNTVGEFWWAIRRISGTTITLDNSVTAASASTPKGYVGTTETVTTYKREVPTVNTSTGSGNVTDSGTAGNLITFSGGWNRTDMSTQTDITIVDAGGSVGIAFNLGSRNFVHLDKLYSVRATTSFNITTADCSLGEVGCIGTTTRALDISLSAPRSRITSFLALQGTGDLISFAHSLVIDAITIYSMEATTALRINGRSVKLGTVKITNTSSTMFSLAETYGDNITIDALDLDGAVNGLTQTALVQNTRIKSLTAANITTVAVALRGGNVLRIDAMTLTNNNVGLSFDTATISSKTIIGSLTTSGNTTAFRSLATGLLGDIYVNKSSFAEGSPLSFAGNDYASGRLVFQNYNGTVGAHRTYYGSFDTGATVFADSTTRHSANGLSWKFNTQTTTFISVDFPVLFPVAKVALAANKTATATIWTRRAATTVTGTFRVRGGQLNGIPNDVTASSSAGAGIWETLVLNFTPTQSGVVELDFQMYGATATDLFIHDFSVVQAV